MQVIIDRFIDDGWCEEMQINGKHVLSVYPLDDDCSKARLAEKTEEDYDLKTGKYLLSCKEIAKLMKMAHQAGWNKEDFHILVNEPA